MAKNRVEAAKRLVELVEQHPWGITSTELRAATGLSSREIHRLLRASGRVVEGEKHLLPCASGWRFATTWRPRMREDDIREALRKEPPRWVN